MENVQTKKAKDIDEETLRILTVTVGSVTVAIKIPSLRESGYETSGFDSTFVVAADRPNL